MKVAQRQNNAFYMSANNNMDQQNRPRPHSISIQIPRGQPLAAFLANMSYNRQLSPGGRRINNPGRASDSLTDPYRYERHNSYAPPNPRASVGGVIPISTETFINVPPPAGTTPTTTRAPDSRDPRVDAYSGRVAGSYPERPRRSSLVDQQRGSISSSTSGGTRTRPTVIQSDAARPSSPQKSSRDSKDYYVTPSTTKEPRKSEHKKLYSVNEGTASLVADVDLPVEGQRHHRRRQSDSGDRGLYKGSSVERERGGRGYHLAGPIKPREKSIEDDDAYSYTDAAGMFRETAPAWRETRPRRGSMDRAGGSRERPVGLVDDPRKSNKEIGPPPSTRGWDKLNELGRATSMRDRPRHVPQSPTAARVPQSPNRARVPQSPTRGRYAEQRSFGDAYYVPPRTTSEDRHNVPLPGDRYEQYEYNERREPRRYERRNSVTRPDPSVERRGFGIREPSQDRFARGSDESFEQQNRYRDSGYAVAEPHRRDTAPEIPYHEDRRLEQEKNDRIAADRAKNDERERWERDREAREKEARRREDDRGYNRDYDRERDQRRDRDYELDRERERERERMLQPQQEPERHHHRRDSNRDREYSKESGPRSSGDSLAQPGLSQVAATGVAGAAAAYGVNKALNRNEDRDKPREFERDRERDRLSPHPPPQEAHSDEGAPQDRERRSGDHDRGLGFAFEHPPEPPRSAPPMRDYPEPPPQQPRERVEERDYARPHTEDRAPPATMPPAVVDSDEDYRRRMEQIQRELGRAPDNGHTDSDPERERRRREREQRYRERRIGNGDVPSVVSNNTYDSMASARMPGGYDNESVEGTNSTASRPGLTRKPSILDQPMMMNEPAQIIDNALSDRKENRVRIVDPPTEEEAPKPKGILKRPTEKFPEHPNTMREGVAPLKDVSYRRTAFAVRFTDSNIQATKSGIPPGARWTKIDRRLVNPEALEEAKERFEERLDCVIVLRVLTKEEIQKLADRTRELRGKSHHSHSSHPPKEEHTVHDHHPKSNDSPKKAQTETRRSLPDSKTSLP